MRFKIAWLAACVVAVVAFVVTVEAGDDGEIRVKIEGISP